MKSPKKYHFEHHYKHEAGAQKSLTETPAVTGIVNNETEQEAGVSKLIKRDLLTILIMDVVFIGLFVALFFLNKSMNLFARFTG